MGGWEAPAMQEEGEGLRERVGSRVCVVTSDCPKPYPHARDRPPTHGPTLSI